VIVVDAGCLFEVVTNRDGAIDLADRLATDATAAPHIIDVEVLGVIRRELMLGRLDPSSARRAIDRTIVWGGERFAHRSLLERAWQLRDNVRGWDAMYVALAEVLDATLITKDHRLAAANGPRCPIEVF